MGSHARILQAGAPPTGHLESVLSRRGVLQESTVGASTSPGPSSSLSTRESSGPLRRATEHGLFVPGPYQEDITVQKKIVLQEYERMAYKDQTGKFIYVSGDSEMRN